METTPLRATPYMNVGRNGREYRRRRRQQQKQTPQQKSSGKNTDILTRHVNKLQTSELLFFNLKQHFVIDTRSGCVYM